MDIKIEWNPDQYNDEESLMELDELFCRLEDYCRKKARAIKMRKAGKVNLALEYERQVRW